MSTPGKITPAVLVLPQFNPSRMGNPLQAGTTTWVSASLDYGASPDLEVGATVVGVTNWPGHGDPSVGGYLKYRLLKESHCRPAIAVGGTFLGFGTENTRIAFVALRKQVYSTSQGPIALDAGLEYVDVRDSEDQAHLQPFLGAEIALAPQLTFVAEGRPRLKFDNGQPLGLTLVYHVSSGYQLALTWANNGFATHPQFGFGVGFALGLRR